MYKNRCYMPFILYPPDMYDVPDAKADRQLVQSLELNGDGTDFVMYLPFPIVAFAVKLTPILLIYCL